MYSFDIIYGVILGLYTTITAPDCTATVNCSVIEDFYERWGSYSYVGLVTKDVFPVQFGVILHMPSHPINLLCFMSR